MIHLRPTEPADFPAVRLLGLEGEPVDAAAFTAEIEKGDAATVRMVAASDGVVRGAARMVLPARPRLRHLARVEIAAEPAVAGPLLAELTDIAFRRMGQSRMDVNSADRALDAAFLETGFAPWIRRPDGWRREGVSAELITWGRLAPWITPAPLRPPPFPRRSGARLGEVLVRPATPDDFRAWAENMRHPGVLWGTHQTGTRSAAEWRARLGPRPEGVTLVGLHGERVVAHGSVDQLPGPRAHCMVLGISVAAEVQGLGAGDAMMTGLVAEARRRGMARVELQVYADNTRAEALYRKHGFADEGISPLGAWREGDWAWDRSMALVL